MTELKSYTYEDRNGCVWPYDTMYSHKYLRECFTEECSVAHPTNYLEECLKDPVLAKPIVKKIVWVNLSYGKVNE